MAERNLLLVCHWVKEPDGTQWLVPGCMARAHDPDAECTCGTELERMRRQRDDAQRKHRSLQSWNDAIVSAVHAHPDGLDIMQDAARRAGVGTSGQ